MSAGGREAGTLVSLPSVEGKTVEISVLLSPVSFSSVSLTSVLFSLLSLVSAPKISSTKAHQVVR